MNAVVLDTSVLIDFLEKGGVTSASLRAYDRLLIPAAVDAEFRAGIDAATKPGRQRTALFDEFLAEPSVTFLPVGRAESSKYAQLYRYLKRNGAHMPINDLWIAATALVQDAPLCSFDRHFSRIPLLRLAPPVSP